MNELSDQELDALVAEKVMGWKRQDGYNYWMSFQGETFTLHKLLINWNPSTQIQDAMEVEDRIAELGLQLRYAVELAETIPEWETSHDDAIFWHVAHATAKQRCLAALSAIDHTAHDR